MNTKSEESPQENKSLLFAIEDVAKLLRSEVKKEESKLKKGTTTHITKAASPDFVNTVEQIAKLLRTQVYKVQPQKKKRGWTTVKKAKKSK
jgi:ribosome-associated translation inhibitor RaiA